MSLINSIKAFVISPWEKPLQRDTNNRITFNHANLNHIIERITGLLITISIAAFLIAASSIGIGLISGSIVFSPELACLGIVSIITLLMMAIVINTKMNQDMRTSS